MYTVVSTEVRPLRRPAVDELETYARAAAQLLDLEIEEAWWPGVVRHLGVLRDNAARVQAVDLAEPAFDARVEVVDLAEPAFDAGDQAVDLAEPGPDARA
jgi:hypothetical protein